MSYGFSEVIYLLRPSGFQGFVYLEITQAHSTERINGLWRLSVCFLQEKLCFAMKKAHDMW